MCFVFQDYYKTGIMTIPASESTQEMKEACDYLMIPFNEKSIRTNNLSKTMVAGHKIYIYLCA